MKWTNIWTTTLIVVAVIVLLSVTGIGDKINMFIMKLKAKATMTAGSATQ